jgi:opine dehydrogenase
LSEVNVTVVGSGNGGLAVAAEWAQNGHRVSVYSAAEHAHDNIPALAANGGIHSEGRLAGFMPIAYAGTDIEAALDGAEVVFVVGPAFATEPHARAMAPHLHTGMVVIICPTSCVGTLAFKRAANLPVSDDSVLVGETSTLPYASRADGQGTVHVYHRFDTGLFAAAVPRAGTPRLLETLRQVYPATEAAASILQTSLQNGNPVIHPAVTLLNAGLLERTHGGFKFYEEGITPSVGRLMEAVDRERLAIAAALGVTVLSEPDVGVLEGYMVESNYTTGYSTAPGFRGIGAPDRIDSRYLTEDIGYSMVFWTDLARRMTVETPVMDAIIAIGSVVLGEDVRARGARTLKSTGLAEMTGEQLRNL